MELIRNITEYASNNPIGFMFWFYIAGIAIEAVWWTAKWLIDSIFRDKSYRWDDFDYATALLSLALSWVAIFILCVLYWGIWKIKLTKEENTETMLYIKRIESDEFTKRNIFGDVVSVGNDMNHAYVVCVDDVDGNHYAISSTLLGDDVNEVIDEKETIYLYLIKIWDDSDYNYGDEFETRDEAQRFIDGILRCPDLFILSGSNRNVRLNITANENKLSGLTDNIPLN